MMKILANDGLAQSAIDVLENAGFEVETNKVEQDALADAINSSNYEILLVRSATKVRKDLIDACPNLKLIGRGGVGLDNIDVAYAKEKGVPVINTPAASSQSVAELVFAHLFGLCRKLHDSNRQMPTKGNTAFSDLKKQYKGIELRAKTIGIIGFGRIGQSVASYALGMGMKVRAYDSVSFSVDVNIPIEGIENVSVNVETEELDPVLKSSDFISIHTPAQADGKPVIGATEFGKMKDGVIFINASRGGTVDENAMLSALDSKKVLAAGIDVFVNEPQPISEILVHPNVSLTPHTGAATAEAQDRVGLELADQIISHFPQA